MQLSNSSALVDADFMFNISAIKKSIPEILELLKTVLESMEVSAIMHPLVYKNELVENDVIKAIFGAKLVSQITIDKIFGEDEAKKEYYKSVVLDLYRYLTGEYLDLGKETVFTYWKKKCSLGEIHSISLCLLIGCGIFLSDDSDSQYLAKIMKEKFMHDVKVYSRSDLAEIMKKLGVLNSNTRKVFAHIK